MLMLNSHLLISIYSRIFIKDNLRYSTITYNICYNFNLIIRNIVNVTFYREIYFAYEQYVSYQNSLRISYTLILPCGNRNSMLFFFFAKVGYFRGQDEK